MFRKPALLFAALFAATACASLSAQPLVDIDIVDRDTGQWLPEYAYRGNTWVPGEPGNRYAVRLTNTSSERVLVVLSVDGVNAISGQTADPAQTGYVLAPWQSAEIAGWRKSMDDIAQFYFTDLPDSYAARTERPDNVGVIGIAVFRERQRNIPYPVPAPAPPIARHDNARSRAEAKAASTPSAARESQAAADSAYDGSTQPPQQRIGTGHGQREWSPASRTEFVRASRSPAQVTQVRYDAVDNLVALGVLPRRYRAWSTDAGPEAFPGGFAADPPGGG